MTRTALLPAYLLELGETPYCEAWDLQRSLAGAASQGAVPDTVLLLEHPPVITLGRTTDRAELHPPEGTPVDVVETNRGGRSTYHGPGQLVCYPILDLRRHGKDVKRYCHDLEEAVIRTLDAFGIAGVRDDRNRGVWIAPDSKICSIGIHVSSWISTHGLALNVDPDLAPFSEWITACGLDGVRFTSVAAELGRPVSVAEVRPVLAASLAEVFGLDLQALPAEDGAGLWQQPRHLRMSEGRGAAAA